MLSRALVPFTFGDVTDGDVKWLRTCPKVAEPGMFPTVRGWTDPFDLLYRTPGNERIASVLVQDEVPAVFSGALLTGADGCPIIEGVKGYGDDFMLGRIGAEALDGTLIRRIEILHESLIGEIGSLRAEWVFDGNEVWLLQLQQETALSSGTIIVPGAVEREIDFDTSTGIGGLREIVSLIGTQSVGIRLVGNVGMTSHIADILRRHSIPSRIVVDDQ